MWCVDYDHNDDSMTVLVMIIMIVISLIAIKRAKVIR